MYIGSYRKTVALKCGILGSNTGRLARSNTVRVVQNTGTVGCGQHLALNAM